MLTVLVALAPQSSCCEPVPVDFLGEWRESKEKIILGELF